MDDKVCLITGATSGIGKAAATRLAGLGANVFLLCRDAERGQRTLNDIRQKTGNLALELLECDLASQASIREATRRFLDGSERLDVLINNAGANFFRPEETVDGIEAVLAVNYLAPFLLTNLLLNRLKASAPSRIITVTGKYHVKAELDLDDLQLAKGFEPMKAANRAQLAKVIFTFELDRRLRGSGVTANCVHPGAVRTELQNKLPWHWRLLARPISLFFRSPEEGAAAYVRLATLPEFSRVSGKYFERFEEARPSPLSQDRELANRLWSKSENLCGLGDHTQKAD